jgi:hypothetical protein
MVKGTGLQIMALMHFQYLKLSAEFHKNLPSGSIVDKGYRHTDRIAISLACICPLGKKVG